MPRFYRLSKIGARLPKRHNYGPATTAEDCQPGFEVFKGPISSIANTIGPALGTLGEGDFTPGAGYDLLLLIDARASQQHSWNPFSWLVLLPDAVEQVRSLVVVDLHAWLGEQPECLGIDGELDREAIVAWVQSNQAPVERRLEENSQPQQVAFIDTIG